MSLLPGSSAEATTAVVFVTTNFCCAVLDTAIFQFASLPLR